MQLKSFLLNVVLLIVTSTTYAQFILNTSVTDVVCYGESNGTATAIVTGGVTPYSYLWSNGQTDANISGLVAGNYGVTVEDAMSVTRTANAFIDQSAITIATTVTNVSCNGASDGQAITDASGGLSNLFKSEVTLLIPDGVGVCYNQTINVSGYTPGRTIQPGEASQIAVWVDLEHSYAGDLSISITCPNNSKMLLYSNHSTNMGEIKLGGAGNSSDPAGPGEVYIWNSSGTETWYDYKVNHALVDGDGLPGGVYAPEGVFSDLDGCPLNGNWTIDVCDNQAYDDGNLYEWGVDLLTMGGQTPYNYLWSNGSVVANLTGLCAGIYNGTISDANGCVNYSSFTIAQPASMVLYPNTVRPHCGQNNGEICVSVAGGTGTTYSYNWTDELGNSGPNTACAQNIPAGCYTILVTDDNNCTVTDTYCINDIAGPTLSLSSYDDVTCSGSKDGLINFTVSGGTAPYVSIEWYDNMGRNLPAYSGSSSAWMLNGDTTYVLEVIDAAGCKTTQVQYIVEPDPVISAITTHTNVSCFAGNDGTATVIAGGGSPGYTYSWNTSPVQTSVQATGLSAGVYVVQVTDAHGCPDNTPVSVTITQPDVLNIITTVTEVCNQGGNNGVINTTLSGGTLPYLYNWNTSETTISITGLSIGTYELTVTDGNNCELIESISVSELVALTLTMSGTYSHCGQPDAELSAIITGGTGNSTYSYHWEDGQGTILPDTSGFDNMYAGCYYLTVMDANGCAISDQICISDNPGPSILLLSYQDVTCAGAKDGYVNFNASSGMTPYNISWYNDQNEHLPFFDGSTSIWSANGDTTYTMEVIDAAGCVATMSQFINEPDTFKVSIYQSDTTMCAGQCFDVSVTASGGIPPYQMPVWGGAAIGTTGYSATLCPQPNTFYDYYINMTDANGCISQKWGSTLSSDFLIVDLVDTIIACGETVSFCALGYGGNSINDYQFSWSSGEMQDSVNQSCVYITPTASGYYYVTLSDGCTPSVMDSVYLDKSQLDTVNVFTGKVLEEGVAANGAIVELYEIQGNGFSSVILMQTDTCDVNGDFYFDNILVGVYLIKAIPVSGDKSMATYYGDTHLWQHAIVIDAANTCGNFEINLETYGNANGGQGNISGQVGNGGNRTNVNYSNVQVVVLDSITHKIKAGAITDQNGLFDIAGLFAGTYYLKLDVPGFDVDTTAYFSFDGSYQKYDVIICVDIDQMVLSVCYKSIETEIAEYNNEQKIIAYPNPFHNSTTIEVISDSKEQLTLTLMDIQGKQQRIMTTNNNQFVLQREELASGVYFYSVTNKQGIVGRGKLVVE